MFRSPQYLEKVDYERVNQDTPLKNPGNDQHQVKTGIKFCVRNRDVVYDWFSALASQQLFFSDPKKMTVGSAGKRIYQADDVHKEIFIKNLVEYSDNYS